MPVPLITWFPVVDRLVPVAAPITGVVNAIEVLVQALILPLATVPNAGVTSVGLVNVPVLTAGFVIIGVVRVGLVANTNRPVPVSSVIAARRLALDGTAKNA